MIFLAHRGLWREPNEKNSPSAFAAAFELGFGVETDVRDLDGELVVSHDPPVRGALAWNAFLDLYVKHGAPGRLAINIKADGLAKPLVGSLLDRQLLTKSFVFDMSVPDMRAYLNQPVAVFTRFSDAEPDPCFYDRADGVWVDDFESAWASSRRAVDDLVAGKAIAMVSPELHGKPHEAAWAAWFEDFKIAQEQWGKFGDRVMICTDLPIEARRQFTGL